MNQRESTFQIPRFDLCQISLVMHQDQINGARCTREVFEQAELPRVSQTKHILLTTPQVQCANVTAGSQQL